MSDGTVTPIRGGQRPPRDDAVAHVPAGAALERRPRSRGRVAQAKRRHDVLALAIHGHTNARIAEVLTEQYEKGGFTGISAQAVGRIIRDALSEWKKEDQAEIEAVRAMQLRRLQEAEQGIAAKVKEGNLKAIDRMVKIEALRAKISGTEAPRKHQVSGSIEHSVSREDVEREEEAWLNSGGADIDLDDSAVEEVDAPQE